MKLLALCSVLILIGCSSVKKVALRGAAPLFVDGTEKLTLERSWDFFKDSSPGNLKFLETLYLQDPDNLSLLAMLVKGFAGYAYGVPETLAFEDELSGNESLAHKKNALHLYTRAFDYGMIYFEKKGIDRKKLIENSDDQLLDILNRKMQKSDLVAVLFTAQSWASLINLQKDNIALVSLVPKVKTLFDWVCKTSPDIEYGVCEIFYAQYEASRPKMLGGNPEKAIKLYEEAIKKHRQHLLIRVGYLQYSIIPAFDRVRYDVVAKELREEFSKWDDLNRDNLEDVSEYKTAEKLNLYNAIAQKRFEIIEKYKTKIFEE
jgi:hypothetical protein